MELSVLNLYNLLVRSRLLSETDAQAVFQRWKADAKDANDLGSFSNWLTAQGIVTEFQASLLARGHEEGYFLNQYKILDRLGNGRMAGVFKAIHPSGQIVAVKVLPPSKAKDPHLLGRFQREARLSVGLVHPNIVRTFHVGEANGVHYLVMECLEGETLDEVLQRRGKLTPAEAVPIIYQALLGLQHMNEKGVIHRDIKPANLMLVDPISSGAPHELTRALVKILDIGLARVLSDEAAPGKPDQSPLTTKGTLLGTPDYMAPEQARDARSADIRADIYSLGCVLYHSLAGQPPFPDTSIISQMIRHASEMPPALAEFNGAVPDALQQIVNWMIAKDPNQRYPTPDRAAKALEVFLAAGDELSAAPKSDAKMESYLSWLEMQVVETREARLAKEEAAVAVASKEAAPSESAPSPPPTQLSTPSPQPAKGKAAAKVRAKNTEKQRVAKPSAIPPQVSPQKSEFAFDVDLVPAKAHGTATEKPGGDARLSRRDFIMFAIGAGTVLLAMAVGKLLAWLFPFKKAASPASGNSELTTEK